MIQLSGHVGKVNALAFHPDSQTLASAGADGAVIVWQGGRRRANLTDHSSNVLVVAFSPDGQDLVSGDTAGHIRVRELADVLARADDVIQHTSNVGFGYVEVAPASIYPRPTAEGALVPMSSVGITGIAYLSDTPIVAIAAGNRVHPHPAAIRLQDAKTGVSRGSRSFEYGVLSLATIPKSRTFAICQGHGYLSFWNIVTNGFKDVPLRKVGAALAVSPDGKRCAVAVDYAILVVDIERALPLHTLTGHKGRIEALAFSPDGLTLASGSWDRTVRYWDIANEREQIAYEWPVGRVSALTFSPDGLLAACAGDNGIVCVWDVD